MASSIYKVKRVHPHKDGNMLAYADIEVAGVFAVTGLRVMNGSKGRFVAMPSKKGKDKQGDDKWFDIAFPVTRESREELQKLVLEALDKATTTGEVPADEETPF